MRDIIEPSIMILPDYYDIHEPDKDIKNFIRKTKKN